MFIVKGSLIISTEDDENSEKERFLEIEFRSQGGGYYPVLKTPSKEFPVNGDELKKIANFAERISDEISKLTEEDN